jgi:DNA modification methylase
MEYGDFLAGKAHTVQPVGRMDDFQVNPMLYPFQADIVKWAVRLGRAAIFADCGLGKTLMQLEWARAFAGRVLIVTPIAVGTQTIAEAARIGLTVTRVLTPDECGEGPGIWTTNYERIDKFADMPLDAIVLDESSILKSIDGKTRGLLLREFTRIPYRLCCTATPAPNDVAELANHAEFLGVMARSEMLATWFVHDEKGTTGSGANGWRLKGWSAEAMYRWMAKWAAFIRAPSDLGYQDDGFVLPELSVHDEVVHSEWRPDGMLFAAGLGGVGSRAAVRKDTLTARVEKAAAIIREHAGEQWLVWCGLNAEQDAIVAALGDECASVSGQDDEAVKIERERQWRAGEVRVLVSKPAIFGFGMNWQHCHRMMFLGLGDSYESYYQSIRRCWRFGQRAPVDVRIVISDVEGQIAGNVRRKERDAQQMASAVVAAMHDSQLESIRGVRQMDEYQTDDDIREGYWKLMLGDCVERIHEVPDSSIGLSVFSPPFASLYTYSASDRDMGNNKNYDDFFAHFGYLIPEILRVTKPGRRCCVHVQQVTTTKATHGIIGWRDFRADTVRAFVDKGWVYDGEVVIDKDPQAQAIRTKSKQLMFCTKERDASWLRPAMADYILLFRHPEDNIEPVKPGDDVTNEDWILWARPIWYGIRESDTLQVARARDEKDEKHVCPLQLGTIERCIRLWSNRGDTILSPFAGIGSEGYVALQHGRKFVGIELKPSYWRVARKNLRQAVSQGDLFADGDDLVDDDTPEEVANA